MYCLTLCSFDLQTYKDRVLLFNTDITSSWNFDLLHFNVRGFGLKIILENPSQIQCPLLWFCNGLKGCGWIWILVSHSNAAVLFDDLRNLVVLWLMFLLICLQCGCQRLYASHDYWMDRLRSHNNIQLYPTSPKIRAPILIFWIVWETKDEIGCHCSS